MKTSASSTAGRREVRKSMQDDSPDDVLAPKNVVIVGAPRSGTSLTAAIFVRKGYHLGRIGEKGRREGDDHNPFGYFEADDLIEENVTILRSAGYPHHNTWLFETISLGVIRRIRSSEPADSHRRLLDSYDRLAPWVWKDPRLCFTLPVWWKALDQSTTAVVIVRRDPLEVYRSLLRTGWAPEGTLGREELLQRIERHVLAVEEALEAFKIPCLRVDYDDFRSRPRQLAQNLSEFCGVDIGVADLNFQPRLNHSTMRGRLSSALRIAQRALPRRVVRGIERVVPHKLVAALFPERRWKDPSSTQSEESDEVDS